MKRRYSSIFADTRHKNIETMRDLRTTGYACTELGFYLNGKSIGCGDLRPCDKDCVYTEGVRLDKGHRRKGHGIHLYHALIRTAKKLGARRIYSSFRLNQFSRRMWAEKLPELYKVEQSKHRRKCHRCGFRNLRSRYWIELNPQSQFGRSGSERKSR